MIQRGLPIRRMAMELQYEHTLAITKMAIAFNFEGEKARIIFNRTLKKQECGLISAFFWQGGGDIIFSLRNISKKKLLDFFQITQKRMCRLN